MHILLAEDHTMVAEAIAERLHTRGHDVSIVTTAAALRDRAGRGGVELLVIDVHLDDADGLEVLSTYRTKDLAIPIIVVTGFDSAELRRRAAELGVLAVVPKGESLDRLCEAIAALGERTDGSRASTRLPGLRLSATKVRILELLAAGHTTAHIAEAVALSPHTVEEYIGIIEKRLGSRNRPALIAAAFAHGFLPPPPSGQAD